MFNCCMPNYNMFMGGCCGNSFMNTMFKMQMFKMIMNNIFHPNQPQQQMMPMTSQMQVMSVMPVQNMYSPSIFPAYNMQYPSMNSYNYSYNNYDYSDSCQDNSLTDLFRNTYNSVFRKKTKKSDKSDKSEKTEKNEEKDKPVETEKADETEDTNKTNKNDNTEKSDKADKTDKPQKSEKSENTNTTKNDNGKKIIISRSKITDIVHEQAQKYGVDERLILAMINQESGFTNGLTSHKGAKGLMQLMPATAKELGVTDVNDPEQNIDGGIRYMKKLLDIYNGDIKKALAAYNSGMGNVNDILNGTNKHGNNPKHIKDPSGIPRIKETQEYVKNIYNNYKKYSVS